jgi:hypothetical protein
MTYENIIETVSAIVENEAIYTDEMVLEYTLPAKHHEKMDEHLFYKVHDRNAIFEHRDVVEIEMAGINIRIVKEEEK